VASIVVGPDSSRLVAGDSILLTALLRDSAGNTLTGRLINWTSDDSNVAVVLPDGLVITEDSGRAHIIAQSGSIARSATVTVIPLAFVTGAAGARHSCVVGNNHRGYCWGWESDGQLGDSTAPALEHPAPVAVYAGAIFAGLVAGDRHTCGLALDGTGFCWGANDLGQLGRGAAPGVTTRPAGISGAPQFSSLAAGGGHTCGISAGGVALCWGGNGAGELGDGSRQARSAPVVAAGGVSLALLAAGASHTCALTAAGDAFCWGADFLGQRGDSTLVADPDATPTAGGHAFTTISAGGDHTCALASGGVAYCWGSNGRGESGTGLPDSVLIAPAVVSGGLPFGSLTAGTAFTCGVTTDSLAYCWGANESGQLGDGSQSDRPSPTAVSGGLHFRELRAGAHHTCGITGDFVAYCWGDGTSGQLGQAIPPMNSLVPLRVAGQP
jgi:alpha-tubulin suppressor-like RCC1 family protein